MSNTMHAGQVYALKAYLLKYGVSMRRFSMLMGISPSYLCKITKGKRAYTEDIRNLIIAALNNLEKGKK